MTRRKPEKYLLWLALSLIMVGLTFSSPPQAQDGPSAIPEGSGSIIQPVSWQLTSQDAPNLAEQVRTVVQQFEGAILVKDEDGLFVLSLPSAKLTALHQKLSPLGRLTRPEATDASQAPTILLRLRLGSSSEEAAGG